MSRRTGLILGGVAVVAVIALIAVLVGRPSSDSGTTGGGGTASEAPAPTSPRTESAGADTSAATLLGWGEPSRVDEFDGPRQPGWDIYRGRGHDGNGRRTADAISVRDGILTITGDSEGNTGGLALNPGQMYGRWEGRVKLPASDPTYHALLLLWPDEENWPEGGEVDFMEATSGDRQNVNSFLHYGEDNKQIEHSVDVDATEWHNWAVEWTPDHVIGYLDGREWYRIEDKDTLPPGPMHLCIQLDWFPEDGDPGDVQPSEMQVDWIKEYKVDA
ncbi:glycoside hydrolase family 16 protein [Pseudonocardia sp. RS010]|uniref:glycoside hydrolase family 16 protein n=1 Tax=Pseudonocardia sp. RS010 TaxID=3385979 RepID=UPI0039A2FFA5